MPGITFSWWSSAPAVATIDAAGTATGVLAGAADIIATAPNGVLGTATLTVNAPQPPTGPPPVRFSEIHYDNASTDVGEAIEIEGPANTDLTNWQIVLYNGNGGTAYHTRILSGMVDGSCTALPGRGVAYFEYPTDGIQNGSPDGFALVDAAGNVVEFLSYEGSFAATDGPAAGKTSQDIGVQQASTTPRGQTLQRKDDGTWRPSPSLGACPPIRPCRSASKTRSLLR
jgi:5'-nucleotidase